MKGEPIKYKYGTNLEWTSEKKGIIKSNNKTNIHVACPPEFGGHPGLWSPEDLFVASVEVCLLTTFLWYVNKEDIKITSYTSEAVGTAEMIKGVFKFSLIHVEINIELSDEKEYRKIEHILKKVKRSCLISNSIETEISIDSKIIIA